MATQASHLPTIKPIVPPGDSFEEVVEEQMNPDEEAQALQQAVSSVIDNLAAKAHDQVRLRVNIEARWLKSLRQYHGIYERDVEGALANDDERSKAFINMTRPKTIAWEARLWDLLFPADDKNYGVSPTPVPELTEKAQEVVKAALEAEAQAEAAAADNNAAVEQAKAAGTDPDPAVLAKAQTELAAAAQTAQQNRSIERDIQATMDEAKKRAERMEREIDDVLTECNYSAVSRDIISDACKLGVGIIKGPVISSKARKRWEPAGADQPNVFVLNPEGSKKPEYRRVDPWNFLPDMEGASIDDCEFIFERHIKNASQFRKMAKRIGFNTEAVRAILREKPQHNSMQDDLNFLIELRSLEGESNTAGSLGSKYVIWEYHGPLDQQDVVALLRGFGQEDLAEEIETADDPMEEHMVVLYFCQGKLLKISPDYPMDSCEKIYNVFPFERAEASILGAVGVPHLMRHEQAMLNSAVRMMIDNGALSVGPQVVIDKTQVEPENGKWKLTPRKVWQKRGDSVGEKPPFAIYNIPMNQQQLAGIIELALKFIDFVISMPMLAQGEQGAQVTQTANGMAMLFNSANVVFRRVVKNWDDDMTQGVITRLYDWQMQHSDKEEIKGDMQCEARGTSVLLVREVQSQQLIQIATNWAGHPVIGPAIRVYETLRLTMQTLAINPDDVLVTPDEFERRVEAMAKAPQESPDMIRAQASLEVAKISAQSRLAEGENNKQIAQLNQQTEILKLIQKDGVDLAKVQAMLDATKMKTDSAERSLAAEIGTEMQAKREAMARGEDIGGSGGAVNLSDEKPGA